MYLSADRMHAVQAAFACVCLTQVILAMCCWHNKATRPHAMLDKQSSISKVSAEDFSSFSACPVCHHICIAEQSHKPGMMKQPKHSCVTTLSRGVCCRRCKLWAVRGTPLSASCLARWALYSAALVFHVLLVRHASQTQTPGNSSKSTSETRLMEIHA